MELKPSEYAVAIKQIVTMPDVLERYTSSFAPRKNRIPCPIHNGEDYNFCFSDSGFHCFVCGASGDVIGFVQELFSLRFIDAVKKLNDDFGLGLPTGEAKNSHFDKAKINKARRDAAIRALGNALMKRSDEELEEEHRVRLKVYKVYRDAVERLQPESPDAEPSKEFLHALEQRCAAERKLDETLAEICSSRR